MPLYPWPFSLLELFTWSLLSGLVIPSYSRAFYEETAQRHGYPSSHPEVFPSDELAASVSTYNYGAFPRREESVDVEPRQGFPGRRVLNAARGAADFGDSLTNHGGPQLEHGRHTATEKSLEFEAGIRGTFDPPSPPLVDLTPEDHQWLREIMGSLSLPQRPSFDSSVNAQQDRDFTHQKTDIVSSGKTNHVFNEGMVANSNIVDHRMNTETNSQLDRNRGNYREDDRPASSKRIRKGDPHLSDPSVAISSRNDPNPFPRFNPNDSEQPRGLRLHGDKVLSLPGQEKSQFEAHHEGTSHYINSHPVSTHQEVAPNPRFIRPNLPNISLSSLVPAGAPRAHITQLLSDSIELVGNKALPKYMGQLKEELRLFSVRNGGFRSGGVIHEFEGIAAIHVTWPISKVVGLAPSVIRVQPMLQERKLKGTKEISMILEPLINWMLLKQTAFLYTTGESKKSLQMALDGFIMWFIKGLFTPEGSLPVFGKGPNLISSYDQSAFGALQQLIIDYLSTSTDFNAAHKTASSVIQLWCQDCTSKSGNSRMGDVPLWITITHAIESSLSTSEFWHFMNDGNESSGTKKLSKSKEVQPGHLMKEVKDLDNFELKDLFINPLFEFPTRGAIFKRMSNFFQLIEESSDVIEETKFIETVKGMVTKMCVLSRAAKGNSGCLVKTSPVIPVGLARGTSFGIDNMYCTRLLQAGKRGGLEVIPSRILGWRLVKLLSLIQGYHTVLLHVSERRSHLKIHNSLLQMLYWLSNELFSHKAGFPIFEQTRKNENYFQPGHFRTPQKILIYYLLEPAKQLENDQLFLSLLKYWYKTQFPKVWDTNFTNEFEYWLVMGQAMTNFHVTQRMKLEDIFGLDELKALL